MRSVSISCGPVEFAGVSAVGVKAGATAAAEPLAVTTAAVAGVPGEAGACGSGSRMSAPSPRPNAFLGIGYNLLGKLRVSLSALTMYIIENNRLTETRSFCETHIPRDDGLKYLSSEETAQVRSDLPRQGCTFVVHGQQYPLDFKAGIQ